jgi:hypothetical protein
MGTFSAPMPNVQVLTIAFCCHLRRFWPRVYEYQNSLVDLANRIAQLEDALRVSHGRHTNEPHPLLDEDQLRIKEPFLRQVRQSPDPPTSSGAGSSNNIGSNELAVSLDTLSITESGRSKYIGPTAWSSVSVSLDQIPFQVLFSLPFLVSQGSEF